MRDIDTLLMEEAYGKVIVQELNVKGAIAGAGMALAGLGGTSDAQAADVPKQPPAIVKSSQENALDSVARLYDDESKLKQLLPSLQSKQSFMAAIKKVYDTENPVTLYKVAKRDCDEYDHIDQVSDIQEKIMTALNSVLPTLKVQADYHIK